MDQTFDVITTPTKSDDVTKIDTPPSADLTPTTSDDVTESPTITNDIKSSNATSTAPGTQGASISDDKVHDITGSRKDSVFTKLRSSPRLSTSKRSIFEPVHEVCGSFQNIGDISSSTRSFEFFDS